MTGTQIMIGLVFGCIGMGAFVYGKKQHAWKPLLIGVLLMAYPYFVPQPLYAALIGVALTAALFIFRE